MSRAIFMLVVLMLLGAVATVTVAWTCDITTAQAAIKDFYTPEQARDLLAARIRRSWDIPMSRFQLRETHGLGWNRPRASTSPESTPRFILELRLAGWPMRAMAGEWRLIDESRDTKWLMVMPWRTDGVAVWVPVRPMWPGFLVDTLVYAILLWLLLRGPLVVRSFARARQGLCPSCRYPIGTEPHCADCGAHLSRRLRRRAAERAG